MTTLTVFCPLGLCNRLKVLLSGIALAEAAGREFCMLWPINADCSAPFQALFDSNWPVKTTTAEAVNNLPYISGWFGNLPDLSRETAEDLTIGHPTWLIQPGRYIGHAGLRGRCLELMSELKPVGHIQEKISTFQRTFFRPAMIGMHLRRGDFTRQRPDITANTQKALQSVDRYMASCPTAGIFLSTDDGALDPLTGQTRLEGVSQQCRHRYGDRLVQTTPRTLDRRAPEAIEDALVDLWLLRQTTCFVGTRASSFSELAVFGREIPYCFVAEASAAYKLFQALGKVLGLMPANALDQQQIDYGVPVHIQLKHRIRHLTKQIRQRIGHQPNR